MNLLRTLFKGTERASTRRRLSTWNDHRTRLGKCEMPKHRASKATVLTMSLDWEPHAKTAFPSQIVKHCENDSWQVRCQKKKHTNATETVNTARLHDQWNGPLSTCLLKRVWHARNPQPGGKTRKTYIWLQYSIFLIKDPRNSPKKFWGSQSGHFRAKLKAKKCQRINIENFKFSIFEPGPGNAKYEPQDRHGKRPNEFWKPLNEYFRTM